MTDAKIGYTAGLLDGEGCITVYPKTLYDPRKCTTGYKRSRHLQLTVTISNTNYDVIQWLQTHYGGTLYCRHYKNHFKSLWQWMLNGRPAAAFLHEIEPLLIVKREEAQTALLFAETMEWPMLSTGNRGGRALSAETQRIREFCYRHLHSLKTKGHRPQLTQTRVNGRAVIEV